MSAAVEQLSPLQSLDRLRRELPEGWRVPKGRTPVEEVAAWTRDVQRVADADDDRTWARQSARIKWELEDERFWAGEIDWPAPERDRIEPATRPNLRALNSPNGGRAALSGGKVFDPADDALHRVSPPEYFLVLADVDVPERGGTVRCPLPDHPDRTASCTVYPDPERGWFCHGCHRGGTVVDLAAELWRIPPRGDSFKELRGLIAKALLKEAA